MTNIDDVAQTLAEYERLAISTGATVQILPTLFSADFETWRPVWDGDNPPAYAHARVLRDGTLTERFVVWAESLPAEESWRALWLAKPTKLFGAYADRSVIRRAFRDAIGDRREPDETTATPPAPARDWAAEIDTAADVAAVDALHKEMKTARAVTPDLEVQLRNRREAAAWAPAEETPADLRTASGALRPTVAKAGSPQDFLAPNRAARRAKAKGRRR